MVGKTPSSKKKSTWDLYREHIVIQIGRKAGEAKSRSKKAHGQP
jgi:hypothetical protein